MMFSATLAGEFLGRIARYHLVEQRLLVAVLPQEAAEALHVLPDAAGPGEDDPDVRRRDVDPFVEHLAGNQDGIVADMEALENLSAFLGLGLVRDGRDEKPTGNLVNRGVVVGKDQDAVAAVPLEKAFKQLQLRRRRHGQAFLFAVCLKSSPSFRGTTGLAEEARPTVRAA